MGYILQHELIFSYILYGQNTKTVLSWGVTKGCSNANLLYSYVIYPKNIHFLDMLHANSRNISQVVPWETEFLCHILHNNNTIELFDWHLRNLYLRRKCLLVALKVTQNGEIYLLHMLKFPVQWLSVPTIYSKTNHYHNGNIYSQEQLILTSESIIKAWNH